jgi:hypothetical protein
MDKRNLVGYCPGGVCSKRIKFRVAFKYSWPDYAIGRYYPSPLYPTITFCGYEPPTPPSVCGNGACEADEDWQVCCKDCGCPGGTQCVNNLCGEYLPPNGDQWTENDASYWPGGSIDPNHAPPNPSPLAVSTKSIHSKDVIGQGFQFNVENAAMLPLNLSQWDKMNFWFNGISQSEDATGPKLLVNFYDTSGVWAYACTLSYTQSIWEQHNVDLKSQCYLSGAGGNPDDIYSIRFETYNSLSWTEGNIDNLYFCNNC